MKKLIKQGTQQFGQRGFSRILSFQTSEFAGDIYPKVKIEQILERMLSKEEECPDLYSLMMNYTSKLKIRLKIPTTLIKEKGSPAVLLYTDHKNRVVRLVDPGILLIFFAKSKSERTKGMPKYVVRQKDKLRLFSSKKSVIQAWNAGQIESCILQPYICPPKRKLKKLRVFWNMKQTLRCFLVTKNSQTPLPSLPGSQSHSIFKHTLSQYQHAGMLLKSSFSPSLPHKPTLKVRKPRTILALKHKLQAYILKASSADTVTHEMLSNQLEEWPMEQILGFLNHMYRIADSKPVYEVIVDFLPNDKDEWIFLKCKAVNTGFEPTKSTLDLLYFTQASSVQEESHSGESFDLPKRINSIQERLNGLTDRHKALTQGKQSFGGAATADFLMDKNRPIGTPVKYLRDKTYAQYIERVANEYDRVRKSAYSQKTLFKHNKKLLRHSFEDYSQVLEKVIDRMAYHSRFENKQELFKQVSNQLRQTHSRDIAYLIRNILKALHLSADEFEFFSQSAIAEFALIDPPSPSLDVIRRTFELCQSNY